MLTCDGPKVIEFNVRFGDPEAQVVIPMIADDLAPRLRRRPTARSTPRRSRSVRTRHVGVVLASRGLSRVRDRSGCRFAVSTTPRRVPDVIVFHAGTARRGDEIVTAGGRVLTVVGRGATYEDAIARAYAGVSKISFDGMHYRRDIGAKALPGNATSRKP